jgi:hypothetical protein
MERLPGGLEEEAAITWLAPDHIPDPGFIVLYSASLLPEGS